MISPGTFKLCKIYDFKEYTLIDQALVLYFKKPYSFTGEDVIEIQSHGGIWVTDKILELCIKAGARLAKNGEYTERAFINGKLDLSQAEALYDLIEARTNLSGKNAIKLYSGELGSAIKDYRNQLLNISAEVMAATDFPDEVEPYPSSRFTQEVDEIINSLNMLINSAAQGKILRKGYRIALAGKPNAGKSSLLNNLLKSERAIVTDIAGTTRDVIEESINLAGYEIVLIDTAGLRSSDDVVEKIGIERSTEIINSADLILYLEDISERPVDQNFSASKRDIQELIYGTLKHNNVTANGKNEETSVKTDLSDYDSLVKLENILHIGTKIDKYLESQAQLNLINKTNHSYDLLISNFNKQDLNKLESLILNKIKSELGSTASEETLSINERQANILKKCLVSLEHTKQAAETNLDQEFWLIDLKTAIDSLGEITGESLTEEMLDSMFSKFCIGK
jgi:tRNA modification GTPase